MFPSERRRPEILFPNKRTEKQPHDIRFLDTRSLYLLINLYNKYIPILYHKVIKDLQFY